MNDTTRKEAYVRDELIPDLVARGVITFTDGPWKSRAKMKSLQVKPLVTTGFMLTIPFKVSVQLEQSADSSNSAEQQATNGLKTETIHLVVKITPDCNDEMYHSCQFDTLFENEMIAYTEIIPALAKTELYPRYYYCERKPTEALMVMSDFSYAGWKMAPMVVNLPLDYILLAAKELGRFHGECYGMKLTRRAQFNEIVTKFKESRYAVDCADTSWLAAMSVAPKRAIKSLKESRFKELVPAAYLDKLALLFGDCWAHSKRKVVPKEPLAVICHGDYLRNNMAFRYEDAKDPSKPTQVMMFDFQTLRYASPMIDYTSFLANSTGYDVREHHFETIFRTYHQELTQTVAHIVGVRDPGELPPYFSYESFHRELAEYYSYGFNIASSFLMILHEPMEISFTENLFTEEESIADAWKRGGEPLNRELAAMIYEMYQLHTKHGLEPV
uniref:CHK kinase-like domain-containing protein n=1 Tax=Anopheles atroparvus TaxID=41427 RepID=A0AAG5CPZ4_ANOAO